MRQPQAAVFIASKFNDAISTALHPYEHAMDEYLVDLDVMTY